MLAIDELIFGKYFIDSEVEKAQNKKLVLIIYDIVDNKRRSKFVKLVEGYGIRVQKSAFEAYLNEQQYQKLTHSIPFYITNDDNIRVYKVNPAGQVETWGVDTSTINEDIIII